MKFLLLTMAFLTSFAAGQGYRLELLVNGVAVPFSVAEALEQNGDTFVLESDAERATITFAGGVLDLNIADFGRWQYAHVLAVALERTAPGVYTFRTTVRHFDRGWEDYANVWRVVGPEVTGGERELLHPHDTEQPFTRSQAGVRAAGTVRIEAADNVRGLGGSTIGLDLEALPLTPTIEVSYRLQPN